MVKVIRASNFLVEEIRRGKNVLEVLEFALNFQPTAI
jgi:hypothetical protein